MSYSDGTLVCMGWYILEAVGLWYFLILKPAIWWFTHHPSGDL